MAAAAAKRAGAKRGPRGPKLQGQDKGTKTVPVTDDIDNLNQRIRTVDKIIIGVQGEYAGDNPNRKISEEFYEAGTQLISYDFSKHFIDVSDERRRDFNTIISKFIREAAAEFVAQNSFIDVNEKVREQYIEFLMSKAGELTLETQTVDIDAKFNRHMFRDVFASYVNDEEYLMELITAAHSANNVSQIESGGEIMVNTEVQDEVAQEEVIYMASKGGVVDSQGNLVVGTAGGETAIVINTGETATDDKKNETVTKSAIVEETDESKVIRMIPGGPIVTGDHVKDSFYALLHKFTPKLKLVAR